MSPKRKLVLDMCVIMTYNVLSDMWSHKPARRGKRRKRTMNAQALAQETVEYAIKHMIAKLQAAGYSEQQAAV